MIDIVNPCERCVIYSAELNEYARLFFRGDRSKMRDIYDTLGRILQEPPNPEAEGLIRSHPGICNAPVCVYRKGKIGELRAYVESAMKMLPGMSDEELKASLNAQTPVLVIMRFVRRR